MNKQKALEELENQKKKLQDNLKKYQVAESDLDTENLGADILGPRDDLEYQKMKKELQESKNNEQ